MRACACVRVCVCVCVFVCLIVGLLLPACSVFFVFCFFLFNCSVWVFPPVGYYYGDVNLTDFTSQVKRIPLQQL